jgi:hypothetical protein
LQALAGIKHGMMLDRGTNDVITVPHQPGYGEIVSLSAAAGEYHFSETATEQSRNRIPSALDRSPRFLSMMMDGGRVPEVLAKVRPHRLQNFRQYRGRGVIVEINPPHASIVFPLTKVSLGRRSNVRGSQNK